MHLHFRMQIRPPLKYFCLKNYKSKMYKKMLEELTKPQFIKDDEECQELLQYLIIEGYS